MDNPTEIYFSEYLTRMGTSSLDDHFGFCFGKKVLEWLRVLNKKALITLENVALKRHAGARIRKSKAKAKERKIKLRL
jgi:hypothetical protein